MANGVSRTRDHYHMVQITNRYLRVAQKEEKMLRGWLSTNYVLHPRRTNGTSELYRRDISLSVGRVGCPSAILARHLKLRDHRWSSYL